MSCAVKGTSSVTGSAVVTMGTSAATREPVPTVDANAAPGAKTIVVIATAANPLSFLTNTASFPIDPLWISATR
jgi:hypothetical protein